MQRHLQLANMGIVGRDAELAALAEVLAQSHQASSITVVESDAGIGKTALLSAMESAARDAGMRVLYCQPTATESQLAYAALADLLSSVTDLDALDPIPRGALDRALLRGNETEYNAVQQALDARAVGTGCSAVWRQLARHAAVLIIIDDAHWLDAASAAALSFSFRRLPESNVAVVCARRLGEAWVDFGGDQLRLQALSADAIQIIVGQQVGSLLGGRQLDQIVATAAGNALFARELARRSAAEPARKTRHLQVPTSLKEIIDRRFGRINVAVSEALALVALMSRPDLGTVRRLGLAAAIEAAEMDGLVNTTSGRVVFAHPLFAAAILDGLTSSVERTLHRRLASVTTDDRGESLRHAALGAEKADASLAADLAAMADDLASRGAFESAADFAVLAATLSPDSDVSRPNRFATAAHLMFQRGETDEALRLLDLVDATSAPVHVRVHELLIRAKIAYSTSSVSEATGYATNALALCTDDATLIEVHSVLARVSYHHFPTAAQHAAIALELAERTGVAPSVLGSALIARATSTFMAGGGLDRDLFLRAIAIERDIPVYAADSAFGSFAVMLKLADELDEAREMLLALLNSNDDEGALPFALSHLPQLELWSGNWDAAEDYAARHLDAAVRTGQHDQVAQANANLALLNIFRGDISDATVLAEGLRELGCEIRDPWTERNGLGLLGLIALANGDAEQAVQTLGRWHELSEQMGLSEPGYCRMQADYVEALVATGRVDAAAELARAMQHVAELHGRPTLLAGACRVNALVAATQGHHAVAVSLATSAVEGYATTPLVVEHARSLLTLGQIHRRFKEKSAARTNLQAALQVFERLGASGLAQRARQDLARIGLRPAASLALTQTEQMVAEKAAAGRTVRQVADELFISPKTVEANLTRVYRKLGIRGRVELATWFATRR